MNAARRRAPKDVRRCRPDPGGWHPGEPYPRLGFVVTDPARPPERPAAFDDWHGTAERWIKEGQNAVGWTRPSCHSPSGNAARPRPHALAYDPAASPRPLASPDEVARWSPPPPAKPVEIGAEVVRHGRHVSFRPAGAAVPRRPFGTVPSLIARPRAPPTPA